MTTLGHYQILSPLGVGGMGEVFLAIDTRLNRNVAIKVLPASTSSDDEAQRRMLREARMVATIDHPNVCTIYEIGTDNERPYIVMQYIQGETLSDRISRERLSLSVIVDIARQITAALAEAHSRGIVHRDIKPGNIMISLSGLVKVLDFGLAKSFARDSDAATEIMISTPGLVAGTTPYMSPEQLRADSLDGRSDIFSLGVLLYEMAAGRRPFDRATVGGTMTAILVEDPPPFTEPEMRPLLPLINRALAKKLTQRFESATELLDALNSIGRKRVTSKRKAPPARTQIGSIAVVPFVSVSADRTDDYIEEGLLDRLIAHLSLIKNLRVVRGEVASDAVLRGRVNVLADSVRLELQMSTGEEAGASLSFEKTGREIEALAIEAAARIKDVIREPSTTSKRRRKKEVAIEPAAEKLFLRGRSQWNKRHPDAVRLAIASFQEAVEIEPAYANAWAALADAYLMLGFLQAVPPRDVIGKAKAASLRAIEIDPALAEPHASLGYLAGLFDWDFDTAKRELTEAMRLNPNYAWAPHWFGILLSVKSLDEAMKYVTLARELDPLSPIITTAVGIPLHLNRRYAEAVRTYRRVLDGDAPFAPAHFYLGLTYEQMGDYDGALTHLNRVCDLSGRSSFFVSALGHCLGSSGQPDQARALLSELEKRSRERYVSPLNIMLIHLGLGETDLALTWLEKSLEERAGWLWHTPLEPRFDRLRNDPRFRELVTRYGLAPDAESR